MNKEKLKQVTMTKVMKRISRKSLRNKNKQMKSKRQGDDRVVSEESDESDGAKGRDDLIGEGLYVLKFSTFPPQV